MCASALPQAAFVVASDGIVVNCNQMSEELTGYTCEQLRGNPISRLVSSEDFDAIGPPVAWHDGLSFAAFLQCADGSKIATRMTVSVAQLSGSAEDVFNLVIFPREPLSRAALIRSLPVGDIIEDLPCAFFVIDKSSHLLLWNHLLEGALEMSSDEMDKVQVQFFFDEQERPSIVCKLEAAFEHGYSSIEAELVGKYGKRTSFSFQCARAVVAGQTSVFGTGVDISARKKTELGLQVRERALYSSLNAIVITHCEGSENLIEYVNPAFEQLTGYTFAEAKGRDPRFMRIEGCDVHEHRRLHEAIQSKKSVRSVLRNQKKNGEIFLNELRIDPVSNTSGEVTHFVAVLNDVTETKRYERRLHHLAHHDPLTGLANRTLLLEQLNLAIDDAVEGGFSGALAFLDLDNFKRINDSFGHDAGDTVLCQVAARLRANVRDDDTVARFGGDEFVLLLREQPSLTHIADLIERIRLSINAAVQVTGGEILPGTSIGVSVFPFDGNTVDEILRAADAAMYHAKSLGKNNVQFYRPEIGQAMHQHLLLQSNLSRAINNDELILHYQPKVSLITGKIVGAEALIRWQRPGQDMVPPDHFIPAAEETGLIVPLGDWVLNEACKTLKELAEAGLADFSVSVNLSARQLRQYEFPHILKEILARYQVAPQNLELEVTESQLMDRPADAKEALEALKALGVKLSIDDFGTGYSSLSHLRSFPVDYVKIDRSFLVDLCQGDHAIIPQAIIDLGHNLKLQVIAEGVESIDQLNFLRDHGCDQMQGFYFSPAVSSAFLRDMLLNDIRLKT